MFRTLRSFVSQKNVLFLKSKLTNGTRVISLAAPTIWNQLPIMIKSTEIIDTFRKTLKTYIYIYIYIIFLNGFSTINVRRFHAPTTIFPVSVYD